MVSSSHFWNAEGPGSRCAAGGFGSDDVAEPGPAADGAAEVDAGGAAGPEAGGAGRSVVDGAAGPDVGGSVGPAVAGAGSADGGSATAAACPNVSAQPIASVTATLRRHFTTTHPPCQSCTRTEGRAEVEQSRQIRHTGARVGSDRHRTDFRKILPNQQTSGDLRRHIPSCPRAACTRSQSPELPATARPPIDATPTESHPHNARCNSGTAPPGSPRASSVGTRDLSRACDTLIGVRHARISAPTKGNYPKTRESVACQGYGF